MKSFALRAIVLMLVGGPAAAAATLTEKDAIREFGYLPMKDGTRIAYVVWRPKKSGRYPTILYYSAYADSGAPFDRARRYLEAGYAYVGANVRGTGSSEGTYSYYQPIEGPDGAEVVEWAAKQSWSTGNVGMIGGSYGGHTQIKVAAQRPPHLKAIVPVATEGNEYRDEGRTGGVFNSALMSYWTFNIQPELAQTGAQARIEGGDRQAAAIRARQAPNRAYQEVLEHPLYDAWWSARTLENMAAQVTVPTLLIHGWQDEWIRANGALRLFRLIGSKHRKLVVQNGPHSISRYGFNQREEMRWLDRWVKGERNGVEAEPAVTVYWEVAETPDGKNALPGWKTTYPTWPVPNLQWPTFYLTQAGELDSKVPPDSEDRGVRSYVYPLGTELAGSNEQFRTPPYPHGSLSYRTPPMQSDTALLGSPQLAFFFSTDATDTDFKFTLKDVDPAGGTLFLQRTLLRASLRGVSKALSRPDEIVQSFDKAEKLTPGKIYEVKVSFAAFGHVVRKGHRLELSILAPNQTPDPIWGFLPGGAPSANNVYHGRAYPSSLRLPVVPGERAQKPAPAPGALRNQPYRPAEFASWFCQISSSTSSRHCASP